MSESNQALVRLLIENWAAAVRARDLAGILAHHDPNMVMYDVPYPFQSVGIDAYRETWDTFFEGTQSGVFDIQELHVTTGDDVVFAFAIMKCHNKNSEDLFEPLDFRLTIGLKKLNNQWLTMHEHHSIPSE